MNTQTFERRSKVLTKLEYQHIYEVGKMLDEVAIEYLSEETRDVLLTFPVETDEQFQETAEMLLNVQILFGRPLTPGEAGLFLYSCFDPETYRDHRVEEPARFGQAATEKPPRNLRGVLKRLNRRLFGRNREA